MDNDLPKLKKKKINPIKLYLSIALSIVLLSTFSYAYWAFFQVQEGTNLVRTITCLNIDMVDQGYITLTNTYPIPDSQGNSLAPYKFTVNNESCGTDIDYDIVLNIVTPDAYVSGTNEILSEQYVKTSLDGAQKINPVLINSLTEVTPLSINGTVITKSYLLTSDTLVQNQEKSYDLRLWLDYATTELQAENKVFELQVQVIAKFMENDNILQPKANPTRVFVNESNPVTDLFIVRTAPANVSSLTCLNNGTPITNTNILPRGNYNLNCTLTLTDNTTYTSNLKLKVTSLDIQIATTYNSSSGVPTTVGKTTSLNCTGGSPVYNAQYNRIEISSITNNLSCTLAYTDVTNKTYLNDYITNTAARTQTKGVITTVNGERYQGEDPDNYIWFNNEMWRIIGVFDSASHGQAGQNLVKIIRANPIGGLVWHTSNVNSWGLADGTPQASLNSLLNGDYLNSENGTDSAFCYGFSSASKAKCDYTYTGIKDGYRSMIKEVTWYLGGMSDTSTDPNYYVSQASNWYTYERSNMVYGSNPTSTVGKIGLMYMSDYGYASSGCYNSINLNSYSSSTCTGSNWLYGNGYEWTIVPHSSNSSTVWTVYVNGNASNYDASIGCAARPVLYLDSSVYVISGVGSSGSPYIIGM